MQLPSEFLVTMTPETNAVSGADNAQIGSEEPGALVFADLLQLPPDELPADPTVDTPQVVVGMALPLPADPTVDTPQVVVGMALPLAGNILPTLDPDVAPAASEELQLQPLAVSPSNADMPAVGQDDGNGRLLTLAEGLAGILDSSNEGLPAAIAVNVTAARPVGTAGDPGNNGVAPPLAGRAIHQALPVIAKSTPPVPAGESAVPGLHRDATETSERAPATQQPVSASVVTARLQQDTQRTASTVRSSAALLSGPQGSSVSASMLPVPESGSQLSRQRDTLRSLAIPVAPEMASKRSVDSAPAKRSAPLQFAIESGQETRPVRTHRMLQDLIALQVQTETPGPRQASSVTLPTAHAAFASLPVSSLHPAPSVAAAAPVTSIETPVLDPAWATAVNDRVVWLAGRGIQSAEIRLHPIELGPLQVQVAVDDDSVTVAFTAAHATTRDALELALPRLKDMLAENGLSLADASVSDQGVADQRDDNLQSREAGVSAATEDTLVSESKRLPGKPAIRAPAGLLDTYV